MGQRRIQLAMFIASIFFLQACGNEATGPAGTYLFDGGLAHWILGEDSLGRLFMAESDPLLRNLEFRVHRKNERIIIEYRWHPSAFRSYGLSEKEAEFSGFYELVPSKEIAGDWDLIRFSPYNPHRDPPPRESIPPLSPPVKSYLHRMDAPRVPELFQSISKPRDESPACLDAIPIAENLLAQYPDDLQVRAMTLEVLLQNRRLDELEERLAAWKGDFLASENIFLRQLAVWAEMQLIAHRSADDGSNAFPFAEKMESPEWDLNKRLANLPRYLVCDTYLAPQESLYPGNGMSILNYLETQIMAKNAMIISVMRMIEGTGDEALTLSLSTYKMGKLMNQNGDLMERLIGVAIRAVSIRSLIVYALNCCETPDDFDRFWDALSAVQSESIPSSIQEFCALENPLIVQHMLWSDMRESMLGSETEMIVRHKVADAKFQALRMAAPAKRRFVAKGSFPKTAREFAPLLPDGPPPDPFSEYPMKWRNKWEAVVCYSVGPDGKDDRASEAYDPTNGTVSSGDVFFEVPAQREFPFSRNGTKAKNAADFHRQFPGGLPVDFYATTRTKGLGVTESVPVYVYSFGPDTDEIELLYEKDVRTEVEVHYDPTNGTHSEGDLFIEIPVP